MVPAGNLGNTSAFGKALREARELGLIRRVPRIASVQAAGASPFYRSFRGGFRGATGARPRPSPPPSASATRPATTARVRAIRETRGVVAAVSDREILEAKAVVDAAGIGCEPASAAVGGRRAAARRRAASSSRATPWSAILTGHVLKDPGDVMDCHCPAGRAPQPAGRRSSRDACSSVRAASLKGR